jgi:7-cyano-7-deazaguanine reductase
MPSAANDPIRLLETFPNPHPSRDYQITHVAPEFTSVCPKTGQPDFGAVKLTYIPGKLCVELKSYKFYLQSFRQCGIFYEDITNRILDDLVKALKPRSMTITTEWTPRGGLHSIITASYPPPRRPRA